MNICFLDVSREREFDPTTMKTAMDEAQRLTRKLGQECTIFTADLQLYMVGLFV